MCCKEGLGNRTGQGLGGFLAALSKLPFSLKDWKCEGWFTHWSLAPSMQGILSPCPMPASWFLFNYRQQKFKKKSRTGRLNVIISKHRISATKASLTCFRRAALCTLPPWGSSVRDQGSARARLQHRHSWQWQTSLCPWGPGATLPACPQTHLWFDCCLFGSTSFSEM